MAAELWRQREIKNRPGAGSFKMRLIENNGAPQITDVPAMNFSVITSDPFTEQDYAAQQLTTDTPIIAYRNGEIGTCSLRVNPKVIRVTQMTRHYVNTNMFGGDHKLHEQHKDPNEFYEGQGINPAIPRYPPPEFQFPGESIEINGQTIHGQPFSAAVYFVPSPTD